jgi:lysozyme family protein
MTINDMISHILVSEGGFVNRVEDSGGATNFGITAATLGRARKLGRDATADEVRALTEPEARAIYFKDYYTDPGFGQLASEKVQLVLFDAQVQHPGGMAVKFLQRALGVPDDGVLGPQTLVTARGWDGFRLALHTYAERLEFYGRMVSKNLTDRDKDGIPDNAEFNAGHMQRMSDLLKALAT